MRSLEAAFLIGVEGTTEIWLVRHGDCYEGMAEGPDPALSPTGRRQAEKLAERVRHVEHAAVYCSPARRALETAHLIDPEARVDARLMEMTFELGDQGEIVFTEMPADVVARMTAAIDEIAAAHPGGRVIVVGHAGAFVNYLTDVMRLEPGQLRILPYYTSVSVVRALGDRRMVGALGDTAHLE
ncbi:MAG TPA: histidine phosphatase family protein [Candidatus Limnocylindria bacterium]|nr:histidine phosphatase family protein [Candidatus Limnocylindria bacterium]